MNTLKFKLLSKPRMTALVLVTCSGLGLLAACSNDSNSTPTPVISTGGGGSGGTGAAGAHSGGSDNSAGDNSAGDTNASAGSTQGGSANVGAAGAGEAGEGGAGGAAGEAGSGTGGTPNTCPTSDVGFYNQPTTSQPQPFNNAQRLGTYTTLPTLPGG